MGETMKMERCIRCNHTPDEKDKYCTHCGAPLNNGCSNKGGLLGEPCKKINHPQAIFCASCGSYTTFYKAGLLNTAYQENSVVKIEEDLEEIQDLSHRFFSN